MNIVKNYYKTKDFCIITPYDAQRAEIAGQLKVEGLQWDKVFNVDSFQGTSSRSPASEGTTEIYHFILQGMKPNTS